ncbi:hypothetical protein WJX73_009062 [Symbiochloris irregularis]|uniref:Protein kinase domain-containing protein n=1 Tax=Symbiochloris irregularis TaxID=706552 RepID=A0AAW1NY97_9CHLO
MRHGLIGGRWKILGRLGKGGFAEVFEVEDTRNPPKHYALKIGVPGLKSSDRASGALRNEAKTLQKLQELGCKQLLAVLPDGVGEHEGVNYMVMELAGPNLADLQGAARDSRLDADTAIRAGQQALTALENLHELGWLHRDVKPSNLVLFPPNAQPASAEWRLLDFGTARKIRGPDGQLLPQRVDYKEFRGSSSYASVSAHLLQDLGRVDDLWSWFYMCMEMWEGRLPWRRDLSAASHKHQESPPNKDAILASKQRCQADLSELASGPNSLPAGLREISEYLSTLQFESDPDYSFLAFQLKSLNSASAKAARNAAQVSTGPMVSPMVSPRMHASPAAQPSAGPSDVPMGDREHPGNNWCSRGA